MATLTKKDLLEVIEDMPDDIEIVAQTNALLYTIDRVELKTRWIGKEKKTILLFYGKHLPTC